MLKESIPRVLGTNQLIERILEKFESSSLSEAFEKAMAEGKLAIAELIMKLV